MKIVATNRGTVRVWTAAHYGSGVITDHAEARVDDHHQLVRVNGRFVTATALGGRLVLPPLCEIVRGVFLVQFHMGFGGTIDLPLGSGALYYRGDRPGEFDFIVDAPVTPPAHLPVEDVAEWERQFLNSPRDPGALAAYADWCEENGWPGRAQHFRSAWMLTRRS